MGAFAVSSGAGIAVLATLLLYLGARHPVTCQDQEEDPCAAGPCANGGTCLSAASLAPTPFPVTAGYCCQCPPFYSGQNCTRRDISSTCTVCSQLPSACVCSLAPASPVVADNCGGSECDDSPCANLAQCIAFGAGTCCACIAGTSGDDCATIDNRALGCLQCTGEAAAAIPASTQQPGCVCDEGEEALFTANITSCASDAKI